MLRKKGSLLVFAIWVLMFFSILSVGIYKIVSSQIKVAKVLEGRLTSYYLANAAYCYAKIERQRDNTEYDTLYELRSERRKVLGRGMFKYIIVDEESKININQAPAEVLSRLPGLNEELAEAIINSSLRPFELKEELLLVEGITEDKFNRCKEIITVYGDGAVNINTASREVFSVLGLDNDIIANIEAYRAGPDFKEGTEDDVSIENIDASQISFFVKDQTLLISLKSRKLLDVSSKNLSLQIHTEFLDRLVMSYIIIIEEGKIKRWVEY